MNENLLQKIKLINQLFKFHRLDFFLVIISIDKKKFESNYHNERKGKKHVLNIIHHNFLLIDFFFGSILNNLI